MRKSILIILFALLNILSARADVFGPLCFRYTTTSDTSIELTCMEKACKEDERSVDIPSVYVYPKPDGTIYHVTSIGDNAFGESNITSVTIPESVTSIGNESFWRCYRLRSVTIPESVTSLGNGAFKSCINLTSLTIGEGVTAIGDETFSDCVSLTSVTIPKRVISIGRRAFYICTKLTSVMIPEGVISIGDYAFGECTGLSSITIPKSVISIGSCAFYKCTGLSSVTLQEGITSIGTFAFRSCSSLTSVTIPESVTSVGKSAFKGCINLTSVTIGKGVTSIGDEVFADCSRLTSVTSLAETPPSCGSSVFAVHDTLFVPRGCKAAYQTAEGWSMFAVIKETPCLVTLLVNDETMGFVTGDGEYAYGAQVTLNTIANGECHFVQWSDGNTDNPRMLTVTQDTSLMAEFAVNTYTVTARANDASMGTVSGGRDYAFGSSATLEAVPNSGHHFVKWNDDNTDNPRTLTVTQDTTLTAVFAPNIYTVTVQTNDATMGTVSGGRDYAFGSSATLEAVPNPGYHFVKWSDGNTDNPRTLTVTKDTTFTAEFAINTFTVSVSANNPAWGSVSQSGNSTYDSASSVTITATANEGYRFLNWTKGEAVFSTHADTTFTITENLTLLANFEKIPDEPIVVKTFTVSVSANKPEWGSASQSGNGTYDSASSVRITATPNEGYRFVNWTKGTAVFSIQADTTFTIMENLKLVANFEKIPDEPIVVKTFTVSVSANNPAWGSVSQSGDGTYDSASSVTITATPNEGYRFINWTKGEAVFSTHADTTFKVTENLTIVANFKKVPDEPVVVKTFTVSVSANNPAWGGVSQSGEGTYDSASSVTIIAMPNEGYRFVNWTKGTAVFSIQVDTTFTITENLTLLANFEKIPDEPVVVKTFTVSVSANNTAWGSVSQSGDGTYDSASSVTITATPNEGYRFVNWTKGEAVFSTHADTTFMVTENLVLVANFEKVPDEPVANESRQDDNFRVYVQGRTIYLSEERGLVQVYNMAGQCVYNGHATAIPVPQSGVYIVAVGPQRFKVLVR